MSTMTKAATDVLAERERQKIAEKWTVEHDDQYQDGQLAKAAASYARHAGHSEKNREYLRRLETPPKEWPWAWQWWKPKTPRADLVRAGALILAEIERLDRKAEGPDEVGEQVLRPSSDGAHHD